MLNKYDPYSYTNPRKPKLTSREFARIIPAEFEGNVSPQELSRMYGDYAKSQYTDPYDWLYDEVYSRKSNPDAGVNMILFGTFGLLVWMAYKEGYLNFLKPESWGYSRDGGSTTGGGGGGTTALPPANTVKNAPPRADPVFPSMTSQGVSYEDVERAFSAVLTEMRTKGYQVWEERWGEVDPARTLQSILPYKDDNWIPSYLIDPTLYVLQYNNSVKIVNARPRFEGAGGM